MRDAVNTERPAVSTEKHVAGQYFAVVLEVDSSVNAPHPLAIYAASASFKFYSFTPDKYLRKFSV